MIFKLIVPPKNGLMKVTQKSQIQKIYGCKEAVPLSKTIKKINRLSKNAPIVRIKSCYETIDYEKGGVKSFYCKHSTNVTLPPA